MKILNLLKKLNSAEQKSKTKNIQLLNKGQLKKLTGGTEQTLGGKAHYGSANNG